LALLAGPACGGDDEETPAAGDTTTTTALADDAHNDADASFVRELLPHHRSLLALAALAPEQAASPQVLALAEGITSSREPEVARMEGWLGEWGEATPSAVASPPPELAAARPEAFDRMFAELVLEHHEAAAALAEDESDEGLHVGAVTLANSLAPDLEDEIADLESILRRAP
jgi:hypothetical protein